MYATIDAPVNYDHLTEYEDICNAAREARETIDTYQWAIGDLATQLPKSYGDHLMEDFARDTGLRISTAKRYRKTAAFYEKGKRLAFLNIGENLSYSHFAAVAGRMSIDEAYEFLCKASDEGWTVDKTNYELSGKNKPLTKLCEFEAQTVNIKPDGSICITPVEGFDTSLLVSGKVKIFRVYVESEKETAS